MIVTVHPGKVSGTIQANASKSAMQRACAAAMLKQGKTILQNPGNSNDDLAALHIIQSMGAEVKQIPDSRQLLITGAPKIFAQVPAGVIPEIHCGESGLSIRMFTPLAALSALPVIISGEGSLAVRPMHFFEEVLPQLGVEVHTHHGRIPMQVRGPLVPKNITVSGELSSQFLTGLLMAYAAANASDVTISVTSLKSKPYIDLTLGVMEQFGLKIPENIRYEAFRFGATSCSDRPAVDTFTVEGDWSGAAFLLTAGAIAGSIEVSGIFKDSQQADKRMTDALVAAGADVQMHEDRVLVKQRELKAFTFDATDCPDLFPPLVALAAHCKGITAISGLQRLKHKESDRGVVLQQEFRKLGVHIERQDDVMLIHGTGQVTVQDNRLHSHNDHRIAMALAIGSLNAGTTVNIQQAESVNKSYPDFWQHLRQMGVEAVISQPV